VRRDDALRGRRSDEVPRLLQETLLGHGITADRISVIADEQEAIEAALRMARAGDLLLVFADALARGWKQIINFRPEADQLVIPPPRAARAVPRAEVSEDSPADDVAPARSTAAPATTTAPPARWNSTTDDVVLMRSERGVMLVPEASD
jgi:cyanophycin synthetase